MAGRVQQKILKTIFQVRRATAAEWEEQNPILRCGEPGYAYDTWTLKVGDGVTAWNDLGGSSGDEVYIENVLQHPNNTIVLDCGTATQNI